MPLSAPGRLAIAIVTTGSAWAEGDRAAEITIGFKKIERLLSLCMSDICVFVCCIYLSVCLSVYRSININTHLLYMCVNGWVFLYKL